MTINALIARRVRELRNSKGLSLDALAKCSSVSRSNISLIERGESSPTAALLDKLAAGLGVTLASLFENSDAPVAEPSPIARAVDQPVWTDPASAYIRRNLSPAAQPIQLVEVSFPAGQRVTYDSVARVNEAHQQVWVIDGVIEITLGDELWRVEAGDCLAMPLDGPIVYHNPSRASARYLVALVRLPLISASRRN
jgi:transcriptional regulator with XRE-family HTH domain